MATPVLTHTTLHLTPAEVWKRQKGGESYLPEAFGQDGFIHCTNDESKLVEIANLFYQKDLRSYYVLDVDLGANNEKTIYEDSDSAFPHIYGPIHTFAVTRVRHVLRADDGTFLGFGEPI
ncbi:MAG: DUF952 domain-containing protein [Thermomicrobiales bacterium]